MKVSLGTIVDEFKKRSIRKRRMMSLVTALSMLVSSGVVWELRSVGITMVNDVGCGIEEHVHGESCYAHSFLCGLEETDDSDGTGHVHSADCFSKELTCEYEEHVHSIECYDDEEEYLLLNRLFDDDDEIPVVELNQDYMSDDEYSDGADSESEDEISDSDDEFPDGSEYDPEYLASMIAAQSEFDEENSEYEDSGESPFMMARASAGDLTYNDNTFYLIKENVTPDTIEEIKLWGQNKDLCILNTDVERKFCITTTADINHSFFATDNDGVIEVKNISRSSNKDTGKNEIVARVTPLKPGTAKLCFDKSTVSGKYEIIEMQIKVNPERDTLYIVDDSGREVKNRTSAQSKETINSTMYQMSVNDIVKVCIYRLNDVSEHDFWASGVQIGEDYLTEKVDTSIKDLKVDKDKVKTLYEKTNEGDVTRVEKHYKVEGKNVFLLNYGKDLSGIKAMYVNVNSIIDAAKIVLNGEDPTVKYTQQNPYQVVVGESFTVSGTTVASSSAIFHCSFEGDKNKAVTLNYVNTLDTGYVNGRKVDAQFIGAQVGLTEVTFEGKSFWVNVRANEEHDDKIYVITALGEREKDRITEAFSNDNTQKYTDNIAPYAAYNDKGEKVRNNGNPYYICVGETVELCFYSSGNNNSKFEFDNNSGKEYIKSCDGGLEFVKNDFDNESSDAVSVAHNFDNGVPGSPFTITLKNDKNEVIDSSGSIQSDKGPLTYNGIVITNCFKLNSKATLTFKAPASGTLTIVAKNNSSSSEYANIKINEKEYKNNSITKSGGVYTYDIPDKGEYTFSKGTGEALIYYIAFTPASTSGKNRNHAIIKGLASGDYAVRHKLSDGQYAYFYIHVISDEYSWKTHSDIEITDGGFYEFRSETDGTISGTRVITVERYDTHIVAINHCYLYDKDKNVHRTFEPRHYQANGTVGSTQYELTSAYYNGSDKENNYYHRGDIKSVQFDVAITLIPSTKTVSTVWSNTGLAYNSEPPVVTDISGRESIEISSAIFNLGLRSVIDAYNKCPNHTGMDFNVSSCLNTMVSNVEIQASKEFASYDGNKVNSPGRTYTFELVDKDNRVVGTTTNDSNGVIDFGNIFLPDGEFVYTLREKIPANALLVESQKYEQGSAENAKGVFYDEKNVTYTVQVTKENGIIKAEYRKDGVLIDNFNGAFKNKVVDEEYTSLTVSKVWSDEAVNNHTNDYIEYSIYRKKSSGTKELVSLGGKTIFKLNKSNNWTITHQGLPTKLGANETYTYEIEEVNIPEGYSPSYSYDRSDVHNQKFTITNSRGDHSYINIQKEWKDVDGNVVSDFSNFGISDVNITLKRKSAKMIPVEIVLKNDSMTGNFTVAEKPITIYVYEGSNFSFKLNPEEMINSGLIIGNRVELSTRYGDSKINISGNNVNVENIHGDQKIIIHFHHVWSWSMEGVNPNNDGKGFAPAEYNWWSTKGDATFRTASQTRHSGTGSLKVVNRTQNWHAARVKIDFTRMTRGKTYHVSAYMLYVNKFNKTDDKGFNNEENGSDLTPTSIKFVLHFLNDQDYTQIKSVDVTGRAGEWIKLDGDFTIPENAGNQNSYFVFQTDERNNTNPDLFVSYFIDDVVITEGYVNADVSNDKKISFYPEYKPAVIGEPKTWYEDAAFSKPVSLSKSSNWRAQFPTSELNESQGYVYQYYAEEERLSGYKAPEYQGMYISANTADNPIKVINQKAVDYQLPPTGGIGTDKVQKAGLIFICFASAGYLFMRRIKRRSG